MNEQSGGSPPGPLSPRPNRRPPRRRRGPRRPPDNRPPPTQLPPGVAAIAAEHTTALPVFDQPPRDADRNLPERYPQPHRPIGSPIAHVVAKVEEIIKTLKETLRDLEEALETLDDAQRQQIGDEKEIESLRRALSMLQRDRQSSRDEPRDRPENRGRAPGRSPESHRDKTIAPPTNDSGNATEEPTPAAETPSSRPVV